MKMNEELLLKNEEFESCIVNLTEMIKRTKLNDVVVKKVFSVMQKLRIKKLASRFVNNEDTKSYQ